VDEISLNGHSGLAAVRWILCQLWRDHLVSVDVTDKVERSFNGPPVERAPSAN
jgi:hypothetical protein